MEDFLELTNININSNFYEQIKQYALKQPNEEVCGFVILNDFGEVEIYNCKNVHTDKAKAFEVEIETFLKISKKNILAIYHSHVNHSANPSEYDLRQSEELCIPFVVYSVRYDNFYIHIPQSAPIKEFTQRQYVDGLQNCFVLTVDFYRKNCDFKFDNFNFYLERKRPTWEFTFETLLSAKNLFRNNGFKKIKKREITANDLIIFQAERNEIHFGVYLGNDQFLHHPFYGFSQKSFFSEKIKDSIHSTYRKSV